MTGRRLNVARADFFPAYVVWELTLRCDQACRHCGSRAAKPRANELTTAEALRVVDELKAMRTREVVLIGGEAYLHDGFLDIVSALAGAGMRTTMTTGGRGLSPELAAAARSAGLDGISVSIDGLETNHDTIRARRGSFADACAALENTVAAGLYPTANTNVNAVNLADLEGLFEHLAGLGIKAWQVQITTPLGRAADHPEMILQPWQLTDALPRIAALKKLAFDRGILLMPGNNLGYFGPEEGLLRSLGAEGRDHWQGCQAGRFAMGIESNGAVKGCPSLQAAYIGGNVRDQSIDKIWQSAPQLAFARARSRDDLWGFCKTCAFADTCLGGCSFTAHALFGRPGNNPYCHFRARTLAKRGVRERLVLKTRAPGEPFDHGLFEIVEEAADAANRN